MFLAEASNSFTGQWVLAALAILGGIAILMGIAAYFATSREVTKIDESITSLDETLIQTNHDNERRAKEVYDRLNPLAERVSNSEGKIEAFEMSFEKFTRVIEANSRASNDTIRAFTQSLETFARVLDQNSRREHK